MAAPTPVDVAECFVPTRATVTQDGFMQNQRRLNAVELLAVMGHASLSSSVNCRSH
jgi:hypothetical protein